MMKNFSHCLLAAALIFIFYSCQKEFPDTDPLTPRGGDNGPVLSDTYLPLGVNTYWKFHDSATGVISTLTISSGKKIINNIEYTSLMIESDSGTDTSYIARDGANYYLYQNVMTGTSSGEFLFHYLNDTAAVGTSWEYLAGQGNGADAFIKTTIVERGISVNINNKTFDNVIHTQLELSYNLLGTLTPAGVYHYYIAKGIGIIRIRSLLNFLGVMYNTVNDCIEYEIK